MKLKRITAALAALLLISGSASAADIFDKSKAYTVSSDGMIFDTESSEYSEEGEWTESGVGFMERKKRTSSGGGSAAVWNGVRPGDNGYYEVYVWRNVVEGGDKRAYIEWFATGSSNGKSYMDCSEGKSGWQYVGTCNTSDLVFKLEVRSSGEGVLPVSCFRLVKTDKDAYVNYQDNRLKNVVILRVDSDSAVIGGEPVDMDMGKAVVVNSRTMVPLRFVMQALGAEVGWNDTAKSAQISANGVSAEFVVGANSFTVNGEVKSLDSPAYIEDGRTMIPLRAVSEGFGKYVYWDDSGVVLIAEEELTDTYAHVKLGQNL